MQKRPGVQPTCKHRPACSPHANTAPSYNPSPLSRTFPIAQPIARQRHATGKVPMAPPHIVHCMGEGDCYVGVRVMHAGRTGGLHERDVSVRVAGSGMSCRERNELQGAE
eukprot:362607-Chlamydomonas_euryale.AAC.5